MSQNKPEIKITWEGMHDIGKRVDGVEVENDGVKWKTSSGIIFTDGFTSCRKILVQENEITVLCKISATLLNRPIFECTVNSKNNNGTHSFRGFTSTTSMKNVFKHLGISPKRTWNGNEFFGLYRDVKKRLLLKRNRKLMIKTSPLFQQQQQQLIKQPYLGQALFLWEV